MQLTFDVDRNHRVCDYRGVILVIENRGRGRLEEIRDAIQAQLNHEIDMRDKAGK